MLICYICERPFNLQSMKNGFIGEKLTHPVRTWFKSRFFISRWCDLYLHSLSLNTCLDLGELLRSNSPRFCTSNKLLKANDSKGVKQKRITSWRGWSSKWSPKSVVYEVGEVFKPASNPFSFMGKTCSLNNHISSFIKMN